MNSRSMEILDDKENVEADTFPSVKRVPNGDAIRGTSGSIWEALANEGQIMRIGKRTPFNPINLESLQNISNLKVTSERNNGETFNEQKPKTPFNISRNSDFSLLSNPKILKKPPLEGIEEKLQYHPSTGNKVGNTKLFMPGDISHSSANQNQIQMKIPGNNSTVLNTQRKDLPVIQPPKSNYSERTENSLLNTTNTKNEKIAEKTQKMLDQEALITDKSQHKPAASKNCSDMLLLNRSPFINKLFMKELGKTMEIEGAKSISSVKNQHSDNLRSENYEDNKLAKKSDSMEIINQGTKYISSLRTKGDFSIEARANLPVISATPESIFTPKGRHREDIIQSDEKVELNRLLDFEPQAEVQIQETPVRALRNISEYKTPQSGSIKKSLLDVKSMSKNQIIQNIQSLIEANNNSISSGLSTPLQSRVYRITSSESSSMKKLYNSILRDSPNTVALHSSVNFLSDLKTSIHESLKALHNAFQDSKAPLPALTQYSESSGLERSITTLAEKAKGYKTRDSQSTFEDILKQLEQEAKQKPKQIDSLDVLLANKLESEFKTKNIKEHQSEAVKRVLNKESCIYRHISTVDRNLVYQLPAFLTKGLIVYISTSISQMAEQINSLPQSICGACYNGLSSKENNQQILDLVRSGEIRILYVTPDKLSEVIAKGDLPMIDYVVIDEFNYNEDQMSNQTSTSQVLTELLNEKGAEWTKLILVPPSSIRECLNLCEIYKISHDSIFPIYLSFDSIPKISISRDEEPNKGLLALLKNQKFGEGVGVVISTNLKRTAEELSAYLGHNGVKNQLALAGKTEAQKLELYSTFTKNNDIVIVTVTGTDIGLDKALIRCIIHYNMPRTPQIFAQEVLYLPKLSNCHIFINEEEYFRERNSAFANTVYKEEIAACVEKIFQNGIASSDTVGDPSETKTEKVNGSLLDKRRRDGTAMPVKKSSSIEFNTFISKSLIKPKLEIQENKTTNEPLFIKISDLSQQFKLPKESLSTIFELLEKFGEWIEYTGSIPYTLNVRFLQAASNSDQSFRKIQNTQVVSPIWRILQSKSLKFSGVVRITVPELASDTKLSAAEVLKQIKNLQNQGYLRYEIIEEVFQYKIKQRPQDNEINQIISQIQDFITSKIDKAIQRIDYCYGVCKQFSVQKIDHLAKQLGTNKALSRGSTICFNKSLSTNRVDSNSAFEFEDAIKDPQRLAMKQNLVERMENYLNDEDMNFSSQELAKISDELPVQKTMSQREKSLMHTELQGFVNQYVEQISPTDSSLLDPKALMSPEFQQTLCRQAVKVALGLSLSSSDLEWKTSKLWGRYYKYDPFELTALFNEAIQNLCANFKQLKKK